MSETPSIFRNTGLLVCARVAERLTGVVLTLLVARTVGVEGLGLFATAMAYLGVIGVAGELGVVNLLVREISRDRRRTRDYVVNASILATAFSLVAIAIAEAVLTVLDVSPTLRAAIGVVLLAILPNTLNIVQEAVFVAHQRLEFEAAVTFVSSTLYVVAGSILLYTGHGVVALLGLYVAIQFVDTVLYYFLINRYVGRLSWTFDLHFTRNLLREMRPFAGTSVLSAVFARPEVLILSWFAGARAVGLYSAAVRLAQLAYELMNVFMTNVYPVLARLHERMDERFEVVRLQAQRYLFALSLPVSAALLVAARPVVETLYGSRFHGAVVLVKIIAIGIPLTAVWTVLWRVLSARGEQTLVLTVQAATVAARLALGFTLIPLFGGVGAAVTLPAAYLVHASLLAYCVRRRGANVRVLEAGWRFGLATAGMSAAMWITIQLTDVWFALGIALVAYVLLLVPLRGFTREEYLALRRALFFRPRTR
jgi:O-antigen/teichoic acid export membrane protein